MEGSAGYANSYDIAAPRRRFRNLRAKATILLPLGVLLVILIGWQVSSGLVSAFLVPSPKAVFAALYHLFIGGPAAPQLMLSLQEMYIGLGIGTFLGTAIGFTMGRLSAINFVFDPFVSSLNAVPLIIIIPLLIIWVGVNAQARILFVVLITLWPVLLNVRSGVQNVQLSYLELGRSVGLSRGQETRKIVLVASIPYFIAGLRVAMGLAIIGMVISEMEVSGAGLGFLMMQYGGELQTANLEALILFVGAIGVMNVGLLRLATRIFCPWIESN